MATTLSRMIKKAAASSLVIPLPNRTNSLHRKCTSAIFSTPLKTTTTISRFSTSNSTTHLCGKVFQRTSNQSHHPFSTLAEKRSSTDDYLLYIIKSEIDEKSRKVVAPRDFPFKIVEDNPEDTFIRLTREYHGEEIEVKAQLPYKSFHDVDLSVSVSENGQPTKRFVVEFDRNDITISSLDFKNPNMSCGEPGFSDLDEKLQNAFYIYLEVRGIEPSICSFLFEYLKQKKRDNYIGILKNLKDFLVY